MLLSRVPIDIVEIVIVKSDSYNLFKKLQNFLLKLQESKRVIRINDKLTKIFKGAECIRYILNRLTHREYDKPAYIKYNVKYEYYKYGKLEREHGYCDIRYGSRYDGKETYFKHFILSSIGNGHYLVHYESYDKINEYV